MKKLSNTALSFIFTGVAIAGVAVTSTLAAIRAPKYDKILNAQCPEEIPTKKDKAVAAVKTYWPAFASGAVTIASIIFAEKVNLTEIAALTGTAAFLARNRDLLEAKIISKLGKEAGEKAIGEVREQLIREHYIVKAGPSVEETGRGDLLCYEGYSGRWFRSSEEAVRRAINTLNDRFEAGEYLALNDFYELLGIETTHFGHQYGWCPNSDYYDFPIEIDTTFCEHHELKNMYGQMEALDECILLIDVYTYPMECWQEV